MAELATGETEIGCGCLNWPMLNRNPIAISYIGDPSVSHCIENPVDLTLNRERGTSRGSQARASEYNLLAWYVDTAT